jgi:hypothetical protein
MGGGQHYVRIQVWGSGKAQASQPQNAGALAILSMAGVPLIYAQATQYSEIYRFWTANNSSSQM